MTNSFQAIFCKLQSKFHHESERTTGKGATKKVFPAKCWTKTSQRSGKTLNFIWFEKYFVLCRIIAKFHIFLLDRLNFYQAVTKPTDQCLSIDTDLYIQTHTHYHLTYSEGAHKIRGKLSYRKKRTEAYFFWQHRLALYTCYIVLPCYKLEMCTKVNEISIVCFPNAMAVISV